MSRYIDAEALKKDIARLHVLNDEAEIRRTYEYNPHVTATDFEETLVSVFDAIDGAPTIDIDRPQGSWKEDYNGGGFKEWLDITCSLCGKTLHDIQKIPKDYKYCPFCGARMKGVDDE